MIQPNGSMDFTRWISLLSHIMVTGKNFRMEEKKTVLVFSFEERSSLHLIPTLVLLFFFVYLSSFLNTPTDISNFNYLVLKNVFWRELCIIFCVVANCNYLGTAAACFRPAECQGILLIWIWRSRTIGHWVPAIRDSLVFLLFSSHFIFGPSLFSTLIEWRYLFII